MLEFMVRVVSTTPNAEDTIAYVARVSSPQNQASKPPDRLLNYCIKHGHWSIFEHAFMTVEITTSRAIAAQLLRHRSMYFQEFSLRYSEPLGFCTYRARRQDTKNRQASHDDLPDETVEWFFDAQAQVNTLAQNLYDKAIDLGIAKECARFLLPLSTQTRVYVTGNVRSWIHYIKLRAAEDTQKEHRDIAREVQNLFIDEFPITSAALEWTVYNGLN